MTITKSLRLNTASRKKRLTDSLDCKNNEQDLKAVCSNSSELSKCNQASLNIFLQKFINQMVIKTLIFKNQEKTTFRKQLIRKKISFKIFKY